MGMPTPIAETHIPCIESIFTVGTDPDTAELRCTNGSYTLSFGTSETTSNKSGGAYEDVKTYRKMSGQFTCVYEKGTPPVFKDGEIYAIVIDNENKNGPYLACNARFNEVANTILDVQGGVTYTFTIANQGAITTDRPETP